MSVNILPFSLDRALSKLEDQSVDEDLLHHLPDQPGSVSSSLHTNRPGFFYQYFSQHQVMKSYFVINDQTLEVRLIGTKLTRFSQVFGITK